MTNLLLILPLLAAFSPTPVEVAPGEHLAVLDVGPKEAPAVVLVPGLSGCVYGYRNLQDILVADGLRTVAVAPLGVGLSGRPREADYTLTAQAERLARALDQTGVTSSVVVAQGVSAGMVLRLALDRPDLVSGLVSVEGGAAESAATSTVRGGLKLAKMVAKLGGSRVLRDRYADDLRDASGDPTWVDKRTVRHYFRGNNRDLDGTLEVFLAMTEQVEPAPLVPRLGELDIPVLLLRGGAAHKGGIDQSEVDVLAAGLDTLEIREVPDAGHFIYEENPSAVAQAVSDVLGRVATIQR
ncbi:MAG: alpha/beta fold hydrolase [bacterium]|nr:alpha/beta fold hydrolase [bacterium]